MAARTSATARFWMGLASLLVACGGESGAGDSSVSAAGGQGPLGGADPAGGVSTSGGLATSGGAQTVGGAPLGGGTPTSGGSAAGGTAGSGGASSGGTSGSGGIAPIGGTAGSGGIAPTGGTAGTGGVTSGGTSGSGGVSPAGGTGVGGGGMAGGGGAEPAGGSGGGAAGEPPFTLPVAVTPWVPSAACQAKAAEILGGLDVSQKAAQMIQGETLTTTPSDVTSYRLGAVFGGGSADPPNNSADAWANMAMQYQNAALAVGIPLLYGIDAVHGHNNVRDATMFPHNIGLGCTRDGELVRRVFQATAVEVRGTGINWTFAPTIAAARDERWGRTFESFSEDPTYAAWLGQAAVEGLQGTSLAAPSSILGCAKHFAGDGNTANGTDQGDVVLDEATFRRLAVDQYQPLINSGVATVMISYSQYGTSAATLERVTGSHALITDLLKGEMGFAGIVVSDYNAIMKLPGAGSGSYPPPSAQQVAAGINAGLDMLMMAGTTGTDQKPNWKTALELLVAAAGSSDPTTGIPMSRIDDAVTRILAVKCEMGMFEAGYGVQTDAAQVGSAEHRALAREAVSQSLVVLRNDAGMLPLSTSGPLLVAGTAADSMIKQCGGWTIDWQGLGTGTGHSADADTTAGTTILGGIRAAIGDGNVTFSPDGTGAASGATAAVVVVGEDPYAELHGDAEDLTLQARSGADHTALQNVLASGLPTTLVIVSGRPLLIDPYLDDPNLRAIVAAWLPGSEGEGVADVLFGAVHPTGKLGHSWPRAGQIPINWDDADYASDPPLFPIGHGLTW
jgi:beta-glucosidase